MIDETVMDWGSLFTVVTTLVTVIGAVGGVWWKLHSSIQSEKETRILADAVQSAQLAEFRVEVAKNYATQSSITQVEERVVQAIERLGDRLDRFLESSRNRP